MDTNALYQDEIILISLTGLIDQFEPYLKVWFFDKNEESKFARLSLLSAEYLDLDDNVSIEIPNNIMNHFKNVLKI